MIDLHCHILPGIDDGPATIEESLALARLAVQDGTHTIVATPHVSWRYPNCAETIVPRVEELNARLLDEAIPLEVRPGAEIALTRVADIQPQDLARLTLGGGSWLLIEPPFVAAVYGLDVIVGELRHSGYRIVLAHPERCPAFHREPQALLALVSTGALTSVTAGSLAGRFGKDVRQFAMRMVADGMVHNVASDAHDTQRRSPSIAAELAGAGLDGRLASWLTDEVPAAILAGGEIPPRPAWSGGAPVRDVATRRRWWQRVR